MTNIESRRQTAGAHTIWVKDLRKPDRAPGNARAISEASSTEAALIEAAGKRARVLGLGGTILHLTCVRADRPATTSFITSISRSRSATSFFSRAFSASGA
jgi:hypothetical protein